MPNDLILILTRLVISLTKLINSFTIFYYSIFISLFKLKENQINKNKILQNSLLDQKTKNNYSIIYRIIVISQKY